MMLRRLAELWYHRRIIKDLRDANDGLRDSLSSAYTRIAEAEKKIKDLRYKEGVYRRKLRDVAVGATEVLDSDLRPPEIYASTCAYVAPEKVGVEIKCGGSGA